MYAPVMFTARVEKTLASKSVFGDLSGCTDSDWRFRLSGAALCIATGTEVDDSRVYLDRPLPGESGKWLRSISSFSGGCALCRYTCESAKRR